MRKNSAAYRSMAVNKTSSDLELKREDELQAQVLSSTTQKVPITYRYKLIDVGKHTYKFLI